MTLDVYRGRKTTIQPTNQPTGFENPSVSSLSLRFYLRRRNGWEVFCNRGLILGYLFA